MVTFFFTGAWQPSLLHCVPRGVDEMPTASCRSQTHACAVCTDRLPLPKLLSHWLTGGWPNGRHTEERQSRGQEAVGSLLGVEAPLGSSPPQFFPEITPCPNTPFQISIVLAATNTELLPYALRQIFSRPFLYSALGTFIKLSIG